MSGTMNMNDDQENLHEVEAMLARTARADADSAPAGLESRVFEGSRAALLGSAVASEPVIHRLTPATRRALPWAGVSRLAAALAVAGLAGAVWTASRGPVRTSDGVPGIAAGAASAPGEVEASDWLAMSSSFMGDVESQISSIEEEATGLGERVKGLNSPESLWDEGSSDGAAGGAF